MPQLDSTASEIVAQQKDALLERKELAQKTKDFRKLEDPVKLTEYKSLLKCIQFPTLGVLMSANYLQPTRPSLT
jgi:homeobox protein cut-like